MSGERTLQYFRDVRVDMEGVVVVFRGGKRSNGKAKLIGTRIDIRIYNPQRRLRILVERFRKDSSQTPPRRKRDLFEGLKWPEINYVTNSKKLNS
ncbi:hypothetical protein TNCV_1216551 [Trichonephila clavipes]|nr:hypothetical protein TNCV_1216551 [Trichonephila clavipes]